MKKQIALAYAVASLATAVAIIAVVGSTVGWSEPRPLNEPVALAGTKSVWSVAKPPLGAVAGADVAEEIVYVDETGAPLVGPPRGRRHDDHRSDDSDSDDHGERRSRRHHD